MSHPAYLKNPVVRALSCLVVAGALPAAHAQAPAAGAAQNNPDTVVITARKWTERAIDAPLSVTVVGAEEIKDRGAIRLSEVAVPNVSFLGTENNALPNFSVRGVQSQNRVNVGFDSGIGVYVDGIFMGRGAAFNQETFDVERVEFLRGPQGTLFGKNSVAGAISLTTRDPSKRFTATGSLDLGSDSQRRLSAYLSAPLGSEAVRASVAAYSGQRDGYMRNIATNTLGGNEDVQSVRAKVLLQPSKGLSITLSVDDLRDRTVAASPSIVSGYGFTSGEPYVTNVNLPTSAARNVSGAGLTVNYELGGGLTLTSITSKRKLDTSRTSDTDVGPANIVASDGTSAQDQWSQELRIATGRDRSVSYVAGLYYYEQKVKGTSRSTFGPT
ncbi:MAG: TonB-dependent receptor, partial [Rubrivivax sp.]